MLGEERRLDRRREQHRHPRLLPAVPRRDQLLGIGQHLRPKRPTRLGLLLGRRAPLAFHTLLVEAYGRIVAELTLPSTASSKLQLPLRNITPLIS
jgi:hypothetical protein